MARSMTAYGRAHIQTLLGHFLIEIHSVNRKSLDINTYLPKELLVLDMELRKRIGEIVKRGYVTVRVNKEICKGAQVEIPSTVVMKELHAQYIECAKNLGYDPKEAVPFSMVVQNALSNPTAAPVDETFKDEMNQGFTKAVEALLEMKKVEGKALVADILPRLESIEKRVDKVKELSKEAPERYYEKLKNKLDELKLSHEGDEDRLSRELVIFADKIDVTEEVIRMGSHVQQFRKILKEDKVRVGRELDFLTQEMNREINTIAAKSQEIGITQAVLAMKSELDKIREQLQNIE